MLPTDTVYGLCADAFREEAVRKLYRLKGAPTSSRPRSSPPTKPSCWRPIPELAGQPLLRGPFTLILPNPARRLPWLTGDRPQTIGVRIPELAGEVAAVLEPGGRSRRDEREPAGWADPRSVDEIPEELRDGCAAVLDAGPLPGTPSTVIDLTPCAAEGAVPAGARADHDRGAAARDRHARRAALERSLAAAASQPFDSPGWRPLEEGYGRNGGYDPRMAVAQETLQHLRTAGLAEIDPEIAELLGRELERQRRRSS